MENDTLETGDSQEFAALGHMAGAVDDAAQTAQTGQAPVPPEVQAIDNVKQWAALPRMLGQLLIPVLPEVAPAFSDANCDNLGQHLAICDEAYGWGGAHVPPWAGAAFAAFPMAASVFIAVKSRRDAAREREARPTGETPQFTGGPDGSATTS